MDAKVAVLGLGLLERVDNAIAVAMLSVASDLVVEVDGLLGDVPVLAHSLVGWIDGEVVRSVDAP